MTVSNCKTVSKPFEKFWIMKITTTRFFRSTLFWFFAAYSLPISVFCQPYERVMHLSGTVQLGCTDVTVTSTGGATTNNPNICDADPYRVGYLGNPGSYTFTFSNPIAGAMINAAALDNFPPTAMDELSIEVNGSFYPITNPGSLNCSPNWVMIWPPGTLRAEPGVIGGATLGLMINETMTSLTVANNFTNGLIFSLYILACPPCMTSAGEIVSDPINLCPGDLATAPPATQTVLESGDILQYVLFSNPTDPTNSIVSTNNIPEFTFDPASMSFGTTYHIAAIAGNDLAGNVDLSDPCLDISNFIEVVWHPFPTVDFSASVSDICVDNCHDIQLSFTGTLPFQLIGEVTSGSTVIANFSETYPAYMGVLSVCLPANTPLGVIQIEATGLADSNCTCN